jgi:hypothetical protein
VRARRGESAEIKSHLYPISYILYPISYILYPISYILYPIYVSATCQKRVGTLHWGGVALPSSS